MGTIQSRFDWYECTWDTLDDGRVVSGLALALNADVTEGRGRNGYGACAVLSRGDDELARVYGRSARLGEVHAQVSSESCDEVVPILRRLWPEHRVTRADSSIDMRIDFAVLDKRAVQFAIDRGISYRLFSDSDGGSTRYLGSATSETMVRVYKKTEQLRAMHPERASEIPDGLCRIEHVARPNKREAKSRAATMEPDEFWGLSRWGKAFAEEMVEIDAERVPTHFRRPSNWTRALFYLAEQYGPMTRRRADAVGREQVIAELVEAMGL